MGINRNIVECKYVRILDEEMKRLVLIETLWNVNKQALNNIETVFPVLIETLWNVNQGLDCQFLYP